MFCNLSFEIYSLEVERKSNEVNWIFALEQCIQGYDITLNYLLESKNGK